MPVKDSQMAIVDKRNHRSLDLAAVGVPDIPVLYFIRHGRRLEPIEPHYHKGCYEIGLCLRGAFLLENRGRRYPVRAGDLFINHPEAPHRLLDYPKGTVLYGLLLRRAGDGGCLLRFTESESRAIRAGLDALPPCLAINTNFFRHSFAALLRIYDSLSGERRTLAMTAYAMHMVAALMDISLEKLTANLSDRIALLADEMRKHPAASYDIDTLARRAALSPSHLIAQFKRLTGLPPHQFLLACRIEQAKKQLASSDISIAELALALGFCSQQHFSTHFKRATTHTPLAWRRLAVHNP